MKMAQTRCLKIVLVVVLSVISQNCRGSRKQIPRPAADPAPNQFPFQPPRSSTILPLGSPAIRPTRPIEQLTANAAAFTIEDVKQYVSTHRPAMSTGAQGYTITRAEFLPSRQVNMLLNGARTGVEDDRLLSYVELRGTFSFTGPRGITVSYPRAVEIFDAHTGNLLVAGGLP